MSEPKAYEYSFSGQCAPKGNDEVSRHSSGLNTTFSLGVFQWLPKSKGKGLKKGKGVKRFRGLCSDYGIVKAKAQAYCDEMNKEKP